MKKLALIFTLILGINLISFAQIDDEGMQLFGASRAAVKAYSTFDFGVVKAPVTHEFIIRNTSPNPMVISSLNIPEGVSVMLVNKAIKPMSEGKIIVTVDPKYLKPGQFKLPILVTTFQNLKNGQYVKTTYRYEITGTVQ